MPADVGSVKASFIIDDSQYQDASKRAITTSKQVEGSFGSMTKSLFTAQLAYDAFKKVAKLAVDTIKQGISEYAKQEKAEKMLATALGYTSQELLKQASAMQKLTGVADDSVIAGQAFLAQMGMTEDQIKRLTPAIVDFAQAKGIGLSEAFNLMAKSIGSSTNALGRYGVEIQGAVNSNERVSSAITELNKKFGGQAEAIRGTWEGTSMALDNATGDMLETFGKLAVVVGKDAKNSMISMVESVTDFLNQKDTMETLANITAGIAAGFKVVGDVLGGIFSTAASGAWEVLQDVKNELSELFDGIGISSDAVLFFASILKSTLGVALYTVVKLVGMVIKGFINVRTVIKEVALTVGEFFKALFTGDWDALKEQAKKVGDAFTDMYTDVADDIVDIVKKGQEEFTKIPDSAIKMKNEFSKTFQDMENQIIGQQEEITEAVQKTNNSEKNHIDEVIQKQNKLKQKRDEVAESFKNNSEEQIKIFSTLSSVMASYSDLATDTVSSGANLMNGIVNGIKNSASKMFENLKNSIGNTADTIVAIVTGIGEATQSIMNSVFGYMQQTYSEELELLKEKNAEKLEEIEATREIELDALSNEYTVKQEKLKSQLDAGIISQTQYNQQMAILEKEKAMKEAQIEKQKDAQIKQAKDEAKAEENAQKKKAFEANKANQIANAWIQYAIGTVSAFAGAAQWPGPSMIAGMILAGVMSALLLATAITSTVMISQQQFVPERAIGGRADAGTTYQVNERGEEFFTPGITGYISPASITNDIMENIAGSQGRTVNINMAGAFDGATIRDTLDLEKVTNYVAKKLGGMLKEFA